MGAPRPRPLTLDTGALIALERGSGRMRALVRLAAEPRAALYIPAGVVAQAWRGGPRQAPLAALLQRDHVTVVALTEATARAVGVLCGRQGTTDIVDASVALCARLTRSAVITIDAADLRALDPHLVIGSL